MSTANDVKLAITRSPDRFENALWSVQFARKNWLSGPDQAQNYRMHAHEMSSAIGELLRAVGIHD